jgi:integrating conjugative element protein (TIGR03758 family)
MTATFLLIRPLFTRPFCIQPIPRGRRLGPAFWLAWFFWPALAIAAIVTATDVANAVRNSPSANAFMKANAEQIGALAIAVESGGNTAAFNGSCCYGVLQLNTENVLASGYSVERYRSATLQQQVDAWSGIESKAMKDPVIARLAGMQTFDGQPVDASMLIACVQLGQGNCSKMISSGRCSGFADSNGTTICSMAAKMDAALGAAGVGTGSNPGSGTGTGTGGGGSGTGTTPGGGGGSGTGLGTGSGSGTGSTGGGFGSGGFGSNTGVSPNAAFQQGAGISAGSVSDNIKLILAALVLTWTAWVALGAWSLYLDGKVALHDMKSAIARSLVIVMTVVWLVN